MDGISNIYNRVTAGERESADRMSAIARCSIYSYKRNYIIAREDWAEYHREVILRSFLYEPGFIFCTFSYLFLWEECSLGQPQDMWIYHKRISAWVRIVEKVLGNVAEKSFWEEPRHEEYYFIVSWEELGGARIFLFIFLWEGLIYHCMRRFWEEPEVGQLRFWMVWLINAKA